MLYGQTYAEELEIKNIWPSVLKQNTQKKP